MLANVGTGIFAQARQGLTTLSQDLARSWSRPWSGSKSEPILGSWPGTQIQVSRSDFSVNPGPGQDLVQIAIWRPKSRGFPKKAEKSQGFGVSMCPPIYPKNPSESSFLRVLHVKRLKTRKKGLENRKSVQISRKTGVFVPSVVLTVRSFFRLFFLVEKDRSGGTDGRYFQKNIFDARTSRGHWTTFLIKKWSI
jgi:hypothetical protein